MLFFGTVTLIKNFLNHCPFAYRFGLFPGFNYRTVCEKKLIDTSSPSIRGVFHFQSIGFTANVEVLSRTIKMVY